MHLLKMVRLEKLEWPRSRKDTKAAKVKSKKAKANSVAKTVGGSAAPQQGSGESSTIAKLSSYMFVLSLFLFCLLLKQSLMRALNQSL